jgi:thiamine biosynthesis lipoprotein
VRPLRAFTAQIMGMPISVHVRAEDAERADIALGAEQVFAHLRKVDGVFSLYRPDSELRRWRAGELPTDRLHPWVDEVMELCDQARDLTGGLFTPWLPTSTGRLRLAPPHRSSATFDPTGLVKGWAVSGAAAYLDSLPEVSYCLNAAGDIAVGLGRGLDVAAPWRIGIEDPRQRGRIARTLDVSTSGVATSGSAIRGDHFYDPRTQSWVRSEGSVTVVGPDLLWADVWATAAAIDPGQVDEALRTDTSGYVLIRL